MTKSQVRSVYGCFVAFCALFLSALPGGAQTSEPVIIATNMAKIHGDARPLVAYYAENDSNTLNLGVAVCEDEHSKISSLIHIVALDVGMADYENCDFWLSSFQRPLTCLLLRRSRTEKITAYFLTPFYSRAGEDTPRVFKAHNRELVYTIEGKEYRRDRVVPLNIKLILESKLTLSSPVREQALPPIRIMTMEQVRLEDREDSPVITGILNGKWRFELIIEIDEEAQCVRPGALSVFAQKDNSELVPDPGVIPESLP